MVMIDDDDKVPRRASEYENGPEDTKEGVHKRDQNSKGKGQNGRHKGRAHATSVAPTSHAATAL